MHINRVSVLTCLALLSVAAAPPPHMPASTFLERANALLARGPFGFLSPDLKRLQAEAEKGGDELHAEHAAELAAGRATDYCSPVSKYLAPRELLTGLRAMPPGELQRLDIKQAMRVIFEHDYPCQRTATR